MIDFEFVDLHSHIIWGVDDGAGCIKESMAMLRCAYDDGIQHIVATPHFKKSDYSYTLEELRRKIKKLNKMSEEEGIGIRVYGGNEVYSDVEGINAIIEGKVLTLNDSRYVLLETDNGLTETSVFNIINTVLSAGKIPVLAHVERLPKLAQNIELLKLLNKEGALLLLNGMGITMCETRFQRRIISKILEAGVIFAVASDCHDMVFRKPLLTEAALAVFKILGKEEAKRLFLTNPIRILNNEDV